MAAEEPAAQEDAEGTSDDISSLSAGDPVPGRYIVVLKDDAARGADEPSSSSAEEEPAQVASDMSEDFQLDVRRTYRYALEGFSAEIPEGQVEEVRSDPRVQAVIQDAAIELFAQPTPTGITRTGAVNSTTAKIDGVDGRVNADVAVIDTGIAPHPDLNRPPGADCIDDGYTNYYGDGHSHGTHVAGTIGAIDNDNGVVGVAPGARVYPIKVFNDQGGASLESITCGIEVVTANAGLLEVANMSLGGPATDNSGNWYSADDGNCGARNQIAADVQHRAICESVNAGVTYVVAAGNGDENQIADNAYWYYPAAFDEVITVSNLADFNGFPGGGAGYPSCDFNWPNTYDDYFWSLSNYGQDVDIAAPGTCIRSTSNKQVQEAYRKRIKKKGKWRWVTRYRWVYDYEIKSGTSMASPHVAGAAALIKSWDTGATPSQVQARLVHANNTEAPGNGHSGSQWDLNDGHIYHPEPMMKANNF